MVDWVGGGPVNATVTRLMRMAINQDRSMHYEETPNEKNKKEQGNEYETQSVSPLVWNTMMGGVDGLLEELRNGADINETDSEGYTLLHWAVQNCTIDVIKVLIEKGVRVDAKTSTGETAIDLARKYGNNDAKTFFESYRKGG
ncbi:ankyrin repeat domain-containing protein [Rhodopirellula europaea]|uniref:Ankyrin repeat domain protein n=1 Tax=Rhodopirellula europaea 6C TaxID=1263867 RepID=M2ARK3_9BACT|nr:ankyrin repeat domain-containing protein [Rhodopirellula europaea]EMB15342.1 ankyrin repeat domain protein [Rhodopirellula europaea 6C]